MQNSSYHRHGDRSTTSAPADIAAAVLEIRSDNLSGSQAITRRAAALVKEYLADDEVDGGRADVGNADVEKRVLELRTSLIGAHPAMAPLYNLFESLLECLDGLAPRDDGHSRIRRAAAAFVDRLDQNNRAIASRFCDIIDKEPSLFTHSAGSTVRTALLHCWRTGRRLTVHCTESRPVGEGSALARDLARQGIPTTLSTDSLAFSLLRQAPRPVLVLGADAITPNGVVNKAGTLGLATAARSWGIPLYVLAGSEKFLPSSSRDAHQQERPPEEILSQAPEKLNIINRYFDLTPLDCITGIVTERGLLTPREASLDLAGMKTRSLIWKESDRMTPTGG